MWSHTVDVEPAVVMINLTQRNAWLLLDLPGGLCTVIIAIIIFIIKQSTHRNLIMCQLAATLQLDGYISARLFTPKNSRYLQLSP